MNFSVKSIQDNERWKQIRDWLSSPDPYSNYKSALKKRQDLTGKWLLNDARYKDWLAKKNSILWLYGIRKPRNHTDMESIDTDNVFSWLWKDSTEVSLIGSLQAESIDSDKGSSTVIEHLNELGQGNVQSVVLFYYFDFNDSAKQTVRDFVCSLLLQLVVNTDYAMGFIENLDIVKAHTVDSKLNTPSTDELSDILQQILSSGIDSDITIVLDALDECKERESLMEFLENLYSMNLPHVHLIVTSRPEIVIVETMDSIDAEKICIQSSAVDGDIREYIKHRLRRDKGLKRWPEKVQNEIEATLSAGAQGM